jgi:hypothetical protein
VSLKCITEFWLKKESSVTMGIRNAFLQFQCKTNFRYGYSFTWRNVSVTDKSFQIVDFEVKQNGKTNPFRFTFGTNNFEMIP